MELPFITSQPPRKLELSLLSLSQISRLIHSPGIPGPSLTTYLEGGSLTTLALVTSKRSRWGTRVFRDFFQKSCNCRVRSEGNKAFTCYHQGREGCSHTCPAAPPTLNVDTPRNPSAALFGMYPREMKRASTEKLAHRVLTVALLTVPQATHNPNIHQATTEETKHAPSTQRKTLQICATSNASYEPDARRGARHRDHTFYGAVYTNCPKG